MHLLLTLLCLEVGALCAGERADCVQASELCKAEPGCNDHYETLRQCSDPGVRGPGARGQCLAAVLGLQQSPLFNCRCRKGSRKERQCLAIYWGIYWGDNMYDSSPYDPLNSQLSDLFPPTGISSEAEGLRVTGNGCVPAARDCNLNSSCKKHRSQYITTCTSRVPPSSICSRHKCHRALRQFFTRVPVRLSHRMLFCPCGNPKCENRRLQTIVPACSYQGDAEQPNCLALHRQCQSDIMCRSRLADFLTNCQPALKAMSGCFRENYPACLLAYSGLIGSEMTPNYVSGSEAVAPWCTCSGSGNQRGDCHKFLNFFKENTCLRNAIQGFRNGMDVTRGVMSMAAVVTSPRTPTPERAESRAPDLGPQVTAEVNAMCASLQEQAAKGNGSRNYGLCPLKTYVPMMVKGTGLGSVVVFNPSKSVSPTPPSLAWAAMACLLLPPLTS
ncbi:GDNF family receptor alpha-1 [Callorhinchus milii]|uniref:GDNF family receptor alpha-1 n=1 Tax=Callorhinchus milii TaxID=7868 RepID=UPI001C3F7FF9|nr:GDNF family receptor alpha-1 [Callorhinchus milii]